MLAAGHSRAVYLRRLAVVDSLSRSILIDARLERRLFQSGLSGPRVKRKMIQLRD